MRRLAHRNRGGRAVSAIIGVLAAALVLAGCGATPQVAIDVPVQTQAALPDDTAQQLEDAVAFAMAASGSPGAIVGVWAPWSGSWVEGLGTQDVGAGAKVTDAMRFRIGPITRAMTCDVLYRLAADGTVALDDPVTDYVNGVADLGDVTLEQLCDGTSGIGSSQGILVPLVVANPKREWDPRELASYGLGRERTTEPGVAYRDSDAGYVLLGLALERASGRSMQQLLSDDVFTPLALTETSFEDAAPGADDDAAVLAAHLSVTDATGAMNCAEPLDMSAVSPSTGYTDSGVVSNIDDLGRYAQALAAGSLLPDGTKRLENPLPVADGGPSWFTAAGGTVQAGALVGQYGTVPGYATAAFSDPSSGLTVAVVLNNSAVGSGFAANLAWQLAAIASKAPAAAGETAPEAGLPWTAQQQHDVIAASAVCPVP